MSVCFLTIALKFYILIYNVFIDAGQVYGAYCWRASDHSLVKGKGSCLYLFFICHCFCDLRFRVYNFALGPFYL